MPPNFYEHCSCLLRYCQCYLLRLLLRQFAHSSDFSSFRLVGIRVCPPHFWQVITMCGSRLCRSLTLQLTPGKMKLLQCLQICSLLSVGKRIFADIAIFLAVSM